MGRYPELSSTWGRGVRGQGRGSRGGGGGWKPGAQGWSLGVVLKHRKANNAHSILRCIFGEVAIEGGQVRTQGLSQITAPLSTPHPVSVKRR